MSNHLNRILELRRLADQRRQESETPVQDVETKDAAVVGDPAPAVAQDQPTQALVDDEALAHVGEPGPAETPREAPAPKAKRRHGKIGRPRRPGKTVFLCLGFTSPDGMPRLSSTCWRTGAYGLRKALATLEWSRKETGDDDYLVVMDPAIGSLSLRGLEQWPIARRGNAEIPKTLEQWLAWARANGLPDALIQPAGAA